MVPGYIGARSVKWLERVTVRAEPSESFFQASTYRLLTPETDPDSISPGEGVALGAVALNSDILVPDEGVGTGPLDILARAWDSAAATQPEDPAHLWNPKGYVNNAWAKVSVTGS